MLELKPETLKFIIIEQSNKLNLNKEQQCWRPINPKFLDDQYAVE